MNSSNSTIATIAVAAILLFATTGQYAFGDNVQNDVVAGGNETFAAGDSTTINYRIAANNGDGQTGCNAADTTPATVTINVPTGVSASPGSLTFISCGTNKPVSYSSSTPGDYEITVSVSDSGAGTYNTNPAKFTLHVDEAPLPSDTIAPTTQASLDPASPDGDNGWYVSDVEVTLSAQDNLGGSGVAATTYEIDGGSTETYTGPFTVSDDGEHVVTFRSGDNDGNIEADQSISFKIDQTSPTIDGTATPVANSDGWNNEDVSVAFDCDDATSGIASCEGGTTLTDETDAAGITVTGTATDNAGNTNTFDVGPVRIDKTAPTDIQFTDGEIANDGVYYYGLVPDGPTQCTAQDALSGLDNCSVDSTNGGTSVGSHSYVATAVDNADNAGSITLLYTVNHWTLTGFYSPVAMSPDAPSDIKWNTLKGGQTVPLKFEIFAGTMEFTTTTFDSTPIGTFKTQKISCSIDATPTEDPVDLTTTGGTSFRYDTTSGQYIQNWQTPKQANTCFTASFLAQDGSSLIAYFKLK